MEAQIKIGEAARQAGVSPSTIRLYESKGILPAAARDLAGYRNYSEGDLKRIRLVTGARRLSISFADIQELVALFNQGGSPSPRVLELLEHKVPEADERSSGWDSIKAELHRLQEAALELDEQTTEGSTSSTSVTLVNKG